MDVVDNGETGFVLQVKAKHMAPRPDYRIIRHNILMYTPQNFHIQIQAVVVAIKSTSLLKCLGVKYRIACEGSNRRTRPGRQ